MEKKFKKKVLKRVVGLSAILSSFVVMFVTIGLCSSFLLAVKIFSIFIASLTALFLLLFGIFSLGDKNV